MQSKIINTGCLSVHVVCWKVSLQFFQYFISFRFLSAGERKRRLDLMIAAAWPLRSAEVSQVEVLLLVC